jgi:hypothetical protein
MQSIQGVGLPEVNNIEKKVNQHGPDWVLSLQQKLFLRRINRSVTSFFHDRARDAWVVIKHV